MISVTAEEAPDRLKTSALQSSDRRFRNTVRKELPQTRRKLLRIVNRGKVNTSMFPRREERRGNDARVFLADGDEGPVLNPGEVAAC